jgi:peptidoglycan/LPS O-acetylase OafA/YrhL
MQIYRGLEGARAWLAWTVVLTHVIALTGVAQIIPALSYIRLAGDWAVQLFIIISGFVITHLLLARREPYLIYIGRRALRLFPAYLVSLALAIVILPSTIEAFHVLPWHDPGQVQHFAVQSDQVAQGNTALHVFLHALMLHGAIPNNLLPESEYMFLTPAWSVSLEWQFYLIAPFVVMMLLNERLRHALPVIAIGAFAAYRFGLFGQFYLPSFLPGAIGYFMLGIGTRMAVDKLPAANRYPLALVSGCLIVALGSPSLAPVAAWIALMSYAMLDAQALARPDFTTRLLRAVLDHPVVIAAGIRSYSVYIFHWVVLSSMLCITTSGGFAGTPWAQFGLIMFGTFLLTIVGAECLYRMVEKPAIELGKKLGRRAAYKAHPFAG